MQKARTGRRGTTTNLKMSSMSSRTLRVYRMSRACNNIVTPGTGVIPLTQGRSYNAGRA